MTLCCVNNHHDAQAFDSIDQDPRDGHLTLNEVQDSLRQVGGVSDEEAASIFGAISAHNDHGQETIDYRSFIAATAYVLCVLIGWGMRCLVTYGGFVWCEQVAEDSPQGATGALGTWAVRLVRAHAW